MQTRPAQEYGFRAFPKLVTADEAGGHVYITCVYIYIYI